jgi:hypothetical protein
MISGKVIQLIPTLRATKTKLDPYLAQVQYHLTLLRASPWQIADQDIPPSVQIDGMIRQFDTSKAMNKQDMTEQTLDLEMSEEKVN